MFFFCSRGVITSYRDYSNLSTPFLPNCIQVWQRVPENKRIHPGNSLIISSKELIIINICSSLLKLGEELAGCLV